MLPPKEELTDYPMTLSEVAEYAKRSVRFVQYAVARGKLRCCDFGGSRRRVSYKSDVDAWIKCGHSATDV